MTNCTHSNETNRSSVLSALGLLDILNLPVDKAFAELAVYGAEKIISLKNTAMDIYNRVADEEYVKLCRPLITREECASWMEIQRRNYPQAAYFFISCTENPEPRNDNDRFSVMLALMDSSRHAIPVSQEKSTSLFSKKQEPDIVCLCVPVKTIDVKLMKLLDGTTSVMLSL